MTNDSDLMVQLRDLRLYLRHPIRVDWLTDEDELWERRYLCFAGYRWCAPIGRWRPL